MKDTFDRKIDYLRLSITDRCNLRCRYCMPEEGVDSVGHGGVLSYEELLRIAAAAARLGVRKIRVTGGEPLVRKGVVGFVQQLAELPGQPEITLTTNGLLLGDLAGELKQAGLSRVNISLDSLREDRFEQITRRPGLQRVLDGIHQAAAVGLTPLKINMVPLRGVNADEIADFGRLTLEHPWDVRFIEFMPVSGGLGYSDENRFSAQEIMTELESVGPLTPVERSGPAGPARLFRFRESLGRVGVIPAVSNHFCSECNRLRVTADGRIRPCLLCSDELDIRDALRAGAVDEELEKILLNAVIAKPKQHRVGEKDYQEGRRGMQQIGG
ncbi:GTP 3',8-cyclase MoaA [Trichloromonas sp.]|uniref:GTP 3',8-cyclase MoaA n=1 Tax=Trichloromonas sp. TaxID=3069249 RepID=UPI003D81B052